MIDLAQSALLTLAHAATPAAGAAEVADFAFFSTQGIIALLTLTALEIVLGIDNIVFISILADRLPEEKRARVRTIGLGLAMLMRICLLFLASWIVHLDKNVLFTIPESIPGIGGQGITPKSLVLIVGGLFLIAKATREMHHQVEGHHHDPARQMVAPTVGKVLAQIMLLDLVFSIDSVITAVGMVNNLSIMVTAVIVSVLVMMVAAGPIGRFVSKHPAIKTLALAFLVLIGVLITAEGLHIERFQRGYVYFAMAFSLGVELLNMRMDSKYKARAQHGG